MYPRRGVWELHVVNCEKGQWRRCFLEHTFPYAFLTLQEHSDGFLRHDFPGNCACHPTKFAHVSELTSTVISSNC